MSDNNLNINVKSEPVVHENTHLTPAIVENVVIKNEPIVASAIPQSFTEPPKNTNLDTKSPAKRQPRVNAPKLPIDVKKPSVNTTSTIATTSTAATASAASSTSAQPAQAAPAKRVFVPNLAVRRTEVKNEPETKKEGEGRGARGRRTITPNLRGARGGGNRQPNVIQSHSIFEAGPAESSKRFGSDQSSDQSYSKVVGFASSSNGAGGSSLSAVSVKKEGNEETKIKIEESLIIEDYKEEEMPVYIKLKHEPKETEVKSESRINQGRNIDSKEQKTLLDLFDHKSDQEKLILFQIPENLKLNDLNEGHVGKIKIYKSGKIEFCVDEEKRFKVSLSVAGSFLQDAVALEINETNSADNKLTNLGHISNKVVCSPIFFE